ncbi:hypothetical protein [Halopelagius longus]|uniref:Uncharacterized protein n=1 Tax=Halopelagius longus TaxID=1236180 RepID=A0A1H1GGV9_9EURY|nr:hypothetical protein [Halopelagius longus]RDI69600.1 hypothetical protein DWB78_17650 [Halopelagius longus]SDR12444.1 hypothetical protein SAMN05216278_3664 [Halopelagius longus]
MPDENRFARLGEAIGETDEDADAEEADESGEGESSAPARTDSESAEPTPESEPELDESESEAEADDAESPEASSESTEGEEDETADDSSETDDSSEETAGGPAFEFEDTTAKSMYVRPETVAVLDDAEFEVESHLRREHDVRDLTGREFHDALVRVAAEYPEEVADAILDAREETE